MSLAILLQASSLMLHGWGVFPQCCFGHCTYSSYYSPGLLLWLCDRVVHWVES